MSCGKIGLLHSRSKLHPRFKMSVNVCSDNIFWTAEHFVTKLGIVMQHHEPVLCRILLLLLLLSSATMSRSQQGLIWSEYDSVCYSFWSVHSSATKRDSLATKLGLMIPHRKPYEKKKDYTLKVKVTAKGQNVSVCPDGIFELPCIWLTNLVRGASSWARALCQKIGVLFSRLRSQQELTGLLCSRSRSQQDFKMSMNVCPTISFDSLNFLQPNLVWRCIIKN